MTSDPSLPQTGTNARPGQSLAVVIGAGGMGMAVARRLGQHHRLLLADIDRERLNGKVAELRGEGHDAFGQDCDITAAESVTALAARAVELAPLRVLAHVAGLSPSMADWRTIMRVNLLGARNVEAAFVKRAVPGTAAIFIASLAGHMVPPAEDIMALLDAPDQAGFLDRLEAAAGAVSTTLSYQLSKFALIRLCGQRVRDWGQQGARIVSLSPGLIATPMGALEFQGQPQKYALLAKTPTPREGTMIEIADAVEFLASNRASFISGIDLLVDGGLLAAMRHGG